MAVIGGGPGVLTRCCFDSVRRFMAQPMVRGRMSETDATLSCLWRTRCHQFSDSVRDLWRNQWLEEGCLKPMLQLSVTNSMPQCHRFADRVRRFMAQPVIGGRMSETDATLSVTHSLPSVCWQCSETYGVTSYGSGWMSEGCRKPILGVGHLGVWHARAPHFLSLAAAGGGRKGGEGGGGGGG